MVEWERQQCADAQSSVGAPGTSVSEAGTRTVSTSAPAAKTERIEVEEVIV